MGRLKNQSDLPRKRYPVLAPLLFCTIFGPQSAYGQLAENPIEANDRKHWSFQKPVRPPVPKTVDSQWVRNPIDAFILAKLEAHKLKPSPAADKHTLLRRVTFDLIGLPPTPDEVDNFLKDDRDDAYERFVEKLLVSPHYGERWAQHWLDVVRYAESNGYEGDTDRPSAWRYRDYVVQSFAKDKPFDRFLSEQVAGDELAAGKDVRANADLWVATGMHRCGPVHVISGNVDREELRQEVLTEMVQGMGSAFLGLTMNCARCHDHKFDPISQADYYRLEAFFASTRFKEIDYSSASERDAFQKSLLDTMAKATAIKAKVAELDAPYQKKARALKITKLPDDVQTAINAEPKKRTSEQQKLAKEAEPVLKVTWDETLAVMTPEDRAKRAELRARQHAIEAELPYPPAQAWAVVDDGKPVTTYVLKRGEIKRKMAAVEPAFVRVVFAGEKKSARLPLAAVVGGLAQPSAPLTRLDLARWLTSPDHPLTARVFVNRLWQHHFGQGIVNTPNDFGTRGARPTHPELLDYLATEFMAKGWRVKEMHRMMVLSNTYRQSSSAKSEAKTINPNNNLLWRMNRHRLESEIVRDAILAAAGTLNRQVGGPMIRVPLEPEVYDLIFTEGEPDGLWPTTVDKKQHTRRSIYLFMKRNVRLPMLEAFDQPDRLTPCANRAVSTFAPQALILMNGPFAQEQSRSMAAGLLNKCGNNRDAQLAEAYRRAFGRMPSDVERKVGKDYLTEQTESFRDRLRAGLPVALPENLPAKTDLAEAAALADYCLALFNTNEFIYVR
jgi:hypothetical protein